MADSGDDENLPRRLSRGRARRALAIRAAAGAARQELGHGPVEQVDDTTDDEALDPQEAREVAAEIRAMAESRGEDPELAPLPDLAELSERSDPRTGRISAPRVQSENAAATSEVLEQLELRDAWPFLDLEERSDGLRVLPREDAEDFFIGLPSPDQAALLMHWSAGHRRQWMRLLEPDDAVDVIQAAPPDARTALLGLLDAATRTEVLALLHYAEDEAGGLMSTRYAVLRPHITVGEALSYLRKQARDRVETIYVAYVLEADQTLLGVVSFRDLFAATADKTVDDVMVTDVVRVNEGMDQESLAHVFAEHDLSVIPVVDDAGHMKGIVTVDDIVDVVQEEATEDIHKFGGMEALDMPYLASTRREMVKKRGVWLCALLIGEMLTATAMGFFQSELDHATVLALFIPLIISSGGNSGSQASTLVIRAMALGEVRQADWWRVIRRELLMGLCLGTLLGAVGSVRILIWGAVGAYGAHWLLLTLTVTTSLVGVVMFGTLAGAGLPFLLRRLGADPASASAPFVATLVDVTGIIIYFSIASLLLAQLMHAPAPHGIAALLRAVPAMFGIH